MRLCVANLPRTESFHLILQSLVINRGIHRIRSISHLVKSENESLETPLSIEEPNRSASDCLARQLPQEDVSFLVNNYTAPALAAAYQDREHTLRDCALLLREDRIDELRNLLRPYQDFTLNPNYKYVTPYTEAFSEQHLDRIRKRLTRLPRQVTKACSRRAAVVIPLCMYENKPSILLTVRSQSVGKHKGEVCFPGGMVDASDRSIQETCLREMEEEVGLKPDRIHVLGILRCDWSNVASITGVAVTPVVGYAGDIDKHSLRINQAEVDSLFVIPIRDLVDGKNWSRTKNATPVFHGGPHVIWGLTAYLLDYCLREVLVIGP
uniref:Uncharacterized protein AlNc14C32G2936 n=1 Tax=Albugo laibachii Nc14 TaxID=890382 RepID=F0W7Y6_9STRA|nr:conserved hypothetical protein [Albugo laibachii Nc14]|eukprot:CCA17239.1 conserved hypothetical protein [Albugo laibachii Nc14]